MGTGNLATLPPHLYRACEAIGQVMELWGFKRIHGMIWMYVFLQPEPVSAQDIRQALGISSGLVSMTLAELQHWDVVHRQTVPGDRKDYYTAEFNIWRPILKVLREREYYQITTALEALRDVRETIEEKKQPELAYAAKQLDFLIQAGELGRSLIGQFLDVAGYLQQRVPRSAWSKEANQMVTTMRGALGKLMNREAGDER
jgi:HTH-type transcriptional regulator, glycine betaine synthesis regulator